MQTQNAIGDLLKAAFNDSTFIATVSELLTYAPEIKHENTICTHLSTFLRKNKNNTYRERYIPSTKRRVDLTIEDYSIEAKYHFEGDLKKIINKLGCDSLTDSALESSKDRSGRTPWSALTQELTRIDAKNYFLWLICIREPVGDNTNSPSYYKCHELITSYYKGIEKPTLDIGIQNAEVKLEAISNNFKELFGEKAFSQTLPAIKPDNKKSALLATLYGTQETEAHPI